MSPLGEYLRDHELYWSAGIVDDLYDALDGLMRAIECASPDYGEDMAKGRRALAKARGEP